MSETMIFGKTVTVDMLRSAINQTVEFESALGEIAQELNEALGEFDNARCKDEAVAAVGKVIEAARLAVSIVEKSNPNCSLYKQEPQTPEDVMWESHLLRGTWPGDLDSGCGCSFCKGVRQ